MINIKRVRLWVWPIALTITLAFVPKLIYANSTNYWWVSPNNGVLVHAIINGDEIQIDKRFPRADRRSAIAIHPTDGNCWVTDSFQGQIRRHTPLHKTIQITGFAAPVALALDSRSHTLWVADAALHFVAAVSMTGKIRQKVEVHSPKALAIGPDGNCWVLTWRGIQPIINGYIHPPIAKEIKYLADTPNATNVWSVNRKGHIYRFNTNGVERLPFALPGCQGLIGTSDGGCWLLTPRQAIRISGHMELVGELTGFHLPKTLIDQPTDGSVWLIDSGYDRAIRLPDGNTPTSDGLLALVGLDSVVRDDAVKRQIVGDLRWESFLPPKSDASSPIVEATQPETLPAQPDNQPSDILLNQESPPVLDDKPDSTSIVEEAPHTVPALDEPPDPTPEELPPATEKTEPEIEPPLAPMIPDNLSDEKPDSTVPNQELPTPDWTKPNLDEPKLEEKPDLTKPTVVRIPPDQTFNHIQQFPNGGVTFVTLYDKLSQKRLSNTEQTLGRRYVWNFDGQSYTFLLGLSVEVYNNYSNRDRGKWVEMVVEALPAGRELAKPMRELAKKKGWNREKLANFVLSFAQSLPYTEDNVATGYDEFKMYAFETLVAGGGDCEDTVFLAASILLALDYDLLLLNPKGHLALGVAGNFGGSYFEHNGKHYFYSETTGTGWLIGDIPDVYQGVSVVLHEVPRPN